MKQAHIHCEVVSEAVILVGDPARVDRIRTYLNQTSEIASNREFISINGYYKNTPITVISTGMGATSTLICVEELILCGAKRLIRVGSAGAYQEYISIGDLILVEGAVRHDGGSRAYVDSAYPAMSSIELIYHMQALAIQQNISHHCGIIRSHDSFYTDQEQEICTFWQKKGILGADMETAALLTLARLRNVKATAVLTNVVEYLQDTKEAVLSFSESEQITMNSEEKAIILALETLTYS
ncbi:MAG: nucleoside phosphorylase [Brevinema sp.]